MAYVTGCTYAVWPIRARRSRILISAAPCGGLRRPAVPLRRPKKRARSAFIILLLSARGQKVSALVLTYYRSLLRCKLPHTNFCYCLWANYIFQFVKKVFVFISDLYFG